MDPDDHHQTHLPLDLTTVVFSYTCRTPQTLRVLLVSDPSSKTRTEVGSTGDIVSRPWVWNDVPECPVTNE